MLLLLPLLLLLSARSCASVDPCWQFRFSSPFLGPPEIEEESEYEVGTVQNETLNDTG